MLAYVARPTLQLTNKQECGRTRWKGLPDTAIREVHAPEALGAVQVRPELPIVKCQFLECSYSRVGGQVDGNQEHGSSLLQTPHPHPCGSLWWQSRKETDLVLATSHTRRKGCGVLICLLGCLVVDADTFQPFTRQLIEAGLASTEPALHG